MKAIRLITLLLMVFAAGLSVQAQDTLKMANNYTISLHVTDENTKEAVIMANCSLYPLGSFNVTDIDGKASFAKVPSGLFTLNDTMTTTATYR